MAYYDFDGKITIDEVAAANDIQKIRAALPYLEAAKNATRRIREESQETKGETGTAIGVKAEELIRMTDELMDDLEDTIRYIDAVVKRYQRLDQEVKQMIQNAGFGA